MTRTLGSKNQRKGKMNKNLNEIKMIAEMARMLILIYLILLLNNTQSNDQQ